jgi:Tol biopolymer transport system component/uncharacterized protein YjdB
MISTGMTGRIGRTLRQGRRTLRASLNAIILLAAAAACGDGGPTGVGNPPPAPVRQVSITNAPVTITAGASVTLVAVARDANGNVLQRPIAWSSQRPAVAAIDAAGVLTAVAAGETMVSATSEGVTSEVRIMVTRRQVVAVVLPVAELALDPQEAQLLEARGRDANGDLVDDVTPLWSTSDATIVDVDQAGRVKALREGAATVAATIDGARAELRVTVRALPVARVVTSVEAVTLEIGDTFQVSARAEAADGTELTGRLMMWGSSANHVVRVPANGLLEAQSGGTAVITVASEGKSAQVTVTVLARPGYALAFDRVSAAGNELFVRDALGALTRLNAGDRARHPSLSPDGQRVVFAVTQRDILTGEILNDLFVVGRDGMNVRHLTKTPGVETDPVWSPDGEWIAFTGTGTDGSGTDIWLVRADGNGLVNLTASATWMSEMHAAWSPDGQSLAFTTMDVFGGTRIETIRRDGSARTVISGAAMQAPSHPTWSPDGRRIAWARSFGGAGTDVVIAPVGGGGEVRLQVAGDESDPVWSPDGEHFAFTRRAGTATEVWTMRVDGSVPRRRADGRNAAWVAR